VAGVRVAATTADAVAVFEAELRRPTRPDDAGPVRPAGNGSSGDGPAPLVLLTRAPADQDTARRLATALTDGAGSAVLLGVWPAGRTWQVDAAGHVQDSRRPDTAARRLCVLGAVAATDLLTVIGQACPGRQPDPHPTSAAALPDQGAAVSVPRVPRQATSPDEPPVTRLPGPDARQVDVRLLGEPAVEFGGKPVTIRRSAAVQVLVFLAVHRQGASAVQLVEAIWPGLAAHTVTGRLYTTVSELRTTLQAACDGPVVERVGDRYRLIPDRLMVDLWQLRDSVHHAATAVAAVQGATAWRAVIDRYTGELAAGHDWPWLAGPREATRRQVIDAYAALAAVEPDPQAALRLLQDAIRVDLFNEDLHRRAVHALSAVGDYQAAVVLLDGYTQRLADVHLEVGEDLRQIAAALRAGRMLQPG
jgi:DNA-binding SARP family transcriptional activator